MNIRRILGGYRGIPALMVAVLLIVIISARLFSYTDSILTAISAEKAPRNIVVIMTDDQDLDSLPVMRNLMAFPGGSWVVFTNAFANNSICCPARATILTGQYSHVTGVTDNEKGKNLDDTNTLPVWLDKGGYQTVLIGKYLNNYPWDLGAGYSPPGWDLFQVDSKGGVRRYSQMAVDFIANSKPPFFLYLAYRAPHYPAIPLRRYADADVYLPPVRPNFNEADVSDKPRWVRELEPLSESTINYWHAERLDSQRALLGVDDGIQRIMEALSARDELETTMIIFMSDNGFSWGSHRYTRKQCAYEECSKFPLLIRYPGLTENREESRLVSNVDLAATIAEYAGVIPELPQDGRSLIPLITNTAVGWREEILLERIGPGQLAFYAIRVPGWKYVEYSKGDVELYDLNADPYELQNLANRPEYGAEQAELARRLRALRDGQP